MHRCYGSNKDLNFTYRGKRLTRVGGTDLYPNCLGTEAGKLQFEAYWTILEFKANTANLARPSQNKNTK